MTRRDRNADAIRRRLLAVGREIFSQRPYSEINTWQICQRASVSQGVLQHHFGSKSGLFMSVFEELQHSVFVGIADAIAQHQDPWERVRASIAALLDACALPAYQAVVLREGPIAIGWERWLELDSAYYGELVQTIIDMLGPAGMGEHASAMLAATMRGALSEMALEIAQSADHDLARKQALAIVDCLLSNCRERPPTSAASKPIRVGIKELGTEIGTYVDRVATGEIIEVTRRGRVLARLQQSTV